MDQRRIRVGSAVINYRVAGVGDPLVLIHGLSGSGRWWGRNVPALARHCRVYCVDLVGFGASQCDQPFALDAAAHLLARWMSAVGIERAAVMGHSMGGFIAADMAAEHPARVERLVLVDAAAVPFAYGLPRCALGALHGLRYTPLSLLPVLASDAYRAGARTLWDATRQLLATDIRHKLHRIQAPTLIVWGERDTLVPLELGRRLSAELPHAQLRVMRGAGHSPMWERPTEFNPIVLRFLAAPARRAKHGNGAPHHARGAPWATLEQTLAQLEAATRR